MAKITIDQLIIVLCERLGWDAGNALMQDAALRLLQDSENWIAQQGSFKYLERETTITLVNNTNSVALPTWVDIGKAMSLGLPDGKGIVQIVPADQFRRNKAYTYGAWDLTVGRMAHIALAADGFTQTIFFDQTATGGDKLYPFSAQQIVLPLANNNNSRSALPETYETSILLKRAEFEGKRELRAVVTDQERADLDSQMAHFFDQQRTGKERPMPDSEAAARKTSEQLEEGGYLAPPNVYA